MNPERWKRLTDLFESALARDPADREAFLASACADDPALRREVESVLASHERAGSFGESPAYRFVDGTASDALATEALPRDTLGIGSRLGRYRIAAPLGAGGMGEVFRACDPHLERDVAVKILSQRGRITTDQRQRFEREAHAVGALNHPNILAVYDAGVENGVPFVVSELLEGETLRARLNAGRLTIRESVNLARQIVSGLTAAHDKGIVHRDLKPENLFLTTSGLVKILDFGLAKRVDSGAGGRAADPPSRSFAETGGSLTADGFVIGTAGYMSPEQIRGADADSRSDVFALGAVMHEMLTGVRAFTGNSIVETMNAVLTTDPPPPSAVSAGVPEPFDRIVQRCLAKDPLRRYQSARDLASALEDARGAWDTAEAAKRPPATRARSFRWRAFAAVSAIVVASAAGLLFVARPPLPSRGASGRPAVAVMPFDDHSGDPNVAWLSTGVPRMLVTALAQTPGLDVIGSERLKASFDRIGPAAGPAARSQAALRAGAGTVLVGSVFKVGSDIRVDVQLEDVASGRVVAATSRLGTDVFGLADALTAEIRAALHVENRPAGRPLRDVTTASLAAYELYARAMDAWHNRRWADARTLFEEALRIDPAFALARAQLAITLERLGEAVGALGHRTRVMETIDRLPERQRLLAEAKQESQSDSSRAMDRLEQLIARYPDEEEAYDLMVHLYSASSDPAHGQRTLALMQRWAQAIRGPRSGHFHNHYGYALMDHALFTEAEREFRAYVRVSPNEANPLDSLAELFLMTGRPQQAIEHYDAALRLNPLFGASYFGRAYAVAALGRYRDALASISRLQEIGSRGGLSEATIHLLNAFIRSRAGRYRDAATHMAEARRLARQRGDTASEADSYLLEAVVAIERRQHAKAVEAVGRATSAASRTADGIIKSRRLTFAQLLLGTADARSGGGSAARTRVVQRQPAGSDSIQGSWRQALAGEIALSAGDPQGAEAAFQRAERDIPSNFGTQPLLVALAHNAPFRDGLPRVYAARGEHRAAIEAYRRLNQPDITSRWNGVLDPRYVLALARLADRTGDREMASAEYRRFLGLWQDADDGLPELIEARRYLGGGR